MTSASARARRSARWRWGSTRGGTSIAASFAAASASLLRERFEPPRQLDGVLRRVAAGGPSRRGRSRGGGGRGRGSPRRSSRRASSSVLDRRLDPLPGVGQGVGQAVEGLLRLLLAALGLAGAGVAEVVERLGHGLRRVAHGALARLVDLERLGQLVDRRLLLGERLERRGQRRLLGGRRLVLPLDLADGLARPAGPAPLAAERGDRPAPSGRRGRPRRRGRPGAARPRPPPGVAGPPRSRPARSARRPRGAAAG